jgi:uncharacterized membrane protein YozB (DUF420 family)
LFNLMFDGKTTPNIFQLWTQTGVDVIVIILSFGCALAPAWRITKKETNMHRQDMKARARKLTVFLAALVLGTLLPARFAWAQG